MTEFPPEADFAGGLLVVRRDNIGDLVCTTPLLASLRAAYPQARLAALVNSYNAPVLDRNPDLDQVYVYTKLKHRSPTASALTALGDRMSLLRRIRRQRFDIAILARSGFDRHGLGFVRWLGIPHVVGFAPTAGRIPATLSHPVPLAADTLQHEVEVLARLAATLHIETPPGPLKLFVAPQGVAAFRATHGPRVLLAVHISAREKSRQMSVEKWIKTLRGLHQALPDAVLAVFWSPGADDDPRHPGDDSKAQLILGAVAELPVLACATATLEALIAGLSACRLFIGADGGALHLAAAAGLPCVALFENTPFKLRHWYPWQVPHEMVTAATFAIGDIDPSAIVAATQRLCSICAAN